jgi:hypothetical protein
VFFSVVGNDSVFLRASLFPENPWRLMGIYTKLAVSGFLPYQVITPFRMVPRTTSDLALRSLAPIHFGWSVMLLYPSCRRLWDGYVSHSALRPPTQPGAFGNDLGRILTNRHDYPHAWQGRSHCAAICCYLYLCGRQHKPIEANLELPDPSGEGPTSLAFACHKYTTKGSFNWQGHGIRTFRRFLEL